MGPRDLHPFHFSYPETLIFKFDGSITKQQHFPATCLWTPILIEPTEKWQLVSMSVCRATPKEMGLLASSRERGAGLSQPRDLPFLP